MADRVNFVFNSILSKSRTECTETSFSIHNGGICAKGKLEDKHRWVMHLIYEFHVNTIVERWYAGDRYGAFIHSVVQGNPIEPPDPCHAKMRILYAAIVRPGSLDEQKRWGHNGPSPRGTLKVFYRIGKELTVDGEEIAAGPRAMLAGWVP